MDKLKRSLFFLLVFFPLLSSAGLPQDPVAQTKRLTEILEFTDEWQQASAYIKPTLGLIDESHTPKNTSEKGTFRIKLKMFIGLMNQYPHDFEAKQFPLFVGSVDKGMASAFAAGTESLAQLLGEIKANMDKNRKPANDFPAIGAKPGHLPFMAAPMATPMAAPVAAPQHGQRLAHRAPTALMCEAVPQAKQAQAGQQAAQYYGAECAPTRDLIRDLLPNHAMIMQRGFQDSVRRLQSNLQYSTAPAYSPIKTPTHWPLIIFNQVGKGGQGAVYAASYAVDQQPTKVVKVSNLLYRRDFDDMNAVVAFNDFFRKENSPFLGLDEWQHGDGHYGGHFFQLMDRYPIDLDHWMPARGGVDKSLAMVLIHQMLQAVSHIHQHGWIHRDIKLLNTMVAQDGSHIKLIDFGAAKHMGTQTGAGNGLHSLIGTPGYLIQFDDGDRGYNGFGTDMAALAVTYFRLRTGKREDLIEIPQSLQNDKRFAYHQKVVRAYEMMYENAVELGRDSEFAIGAGEGVTQNLIMRCHKFFGAGYDDDEVRFLDALINPENTRSAGSETLYNILKDHVFMNRARNLNLYH